MLFMKYVCLFFLLSCMSCSAQVEKVSPLFPCSDMLDNPYGVCAHVTQTFWDQTYHDSLIVLMKEARISNIRFDLWLPYAEKLHNNKQLAVIKEAVNRNYESGLNQLGILFVGWKEQRAWEKKKEYEAFLDTMLLNYKYLIPCWEVLNEVNLTANEDKVSLNSTVSYYMDILPLTYKKIKTANPNILVTSSGISDVSDGFLEQMCQKQGYLYFDVLNFHSYIEPEAFPDKFRIIRELMDRYGWEKPVWITECGYPTHQESEIKLWTKNKEQKESEQALRIPRTYLIVFAYGVDNVFTYSLRSRENTVSNSEDHYGILHADLTPKPAYIAYKTMTKMLPSGSSRPKLIIDGNTYLCSWKRPDGKKVYAVWAAKGKESVNTYIKGDYCCYDVYGNAITIDNNDVVITPSVKYFVGSKNLKFRIK